MDFTKLSLKGVQDLFALADKYASEWNLAGLDLISLTPSQVTFSTDSGDTITFTRDSVLRKHSL